MVGDSGYAGGTSESMDFAPSPNVHCWPSNNSTVTTTNTRPMTTFSSTYSSAGSISAADNSSKSPFFSDDFFKAIKRTAENEVSHLHPTCSKKAIYHRRRINNQRPNNAPC